MTSNINRLFKVLLENSSGNGSSNDNGENVNLENLANKSKEEIEKIKNMAVQKTAEKFGNDENGDIRDNLYQEIGKNSGLK